MKKGKLFLCFLLLLAAGGLTGGLMGFVAGKLIDPKPDGEVIFWMYHGTVQSVEQEENGDFSVELRMSISWENTTLYFPKGVHRFGDIKLADLEVGEEYRIYVNFVEFNPQTICLSYEIVD